MLVFLRHTNINCIQFVGCNFTLRLFQQSQASDRKIKGNDRKKSIWSQEKVCYILVKSVQLKTLLLKISISRCVKICCQFWSLINPLKEWNYNSGIFQGQWNCDINFYHSMDCWTYPQCHLLFLHLSDSWLFKHFW